MLNISALSNFVMRSREKGRKKEKGEKGKRKRAVLLSPKGGRGTSLSRCPNAQRRERRKKEKGGGGGVLLRAILACHS